MLKEIEKEYDFILSNVCSCQFEDEDGVSRPFDICDCWEEAVHIWEIATTDLFPFTSRSVWRVEGWPLWNGESSGIVVVKDARDLLRKIIVQSEFRLAGFVHEDRIEATIWHHDRPTGATFFVRPTDWNPSDV